MLRFFAASLLLTAFSFNPVSVIAFGTCAALGQQRHEVFLERAHFLFLIHDAKSELSDVRTKDPEVANRRLAEATAMQKHMMDNFKHLTPLERAQTEPTRQLVDDYAAYWRGKVTAIETGGIVPGESGDLWVKYMKSKLSRYEESFKTEEQLLERLDAQIRACRGQVTPKPPTAAASSQWEGTWEGNLVTRMSAGTLPGTITYTAEKGPTQAQGSCKTAGNKAICSWGAKYSPSYTVVISGHEVLILLGDTIMDHKVYDDARCYVPPGDAKCEAAARKIKGLTKDIKWTRVK